MPRDETFSYTCVYCNQPATITSHSTSTSTHRFNEDNKDGDLVLRTHVVVCPNPTCREYQIVASLHKSIFNGAAWTYSKAAIEQWSLRPRSLAKTFPPYIPKPILDDYMEACLIADDSPKASATLSRRCLQGMIRDFWKISKSKLIDEIKELEGKIDPTTWQAIDGVRSVGNIGAHMEKDINLIVEVDPDEAKTLIGLIEFLLRDWYIARHERDQHMKRVVDLAKMKSNAKAPPINQSQSS